MSEGGDDRGKKKRLAVIGFSSMLLVAMAVVAAVGVKSQDGSSRGDGGSISASTKAVQAICQPTDYKEICESSLSSAAKNTSDPKELVKAAFEVAMDEINKVSQNSTLLKELEKDPGTKKVVDDCKELFEDAIQDFNRSFNQIGQFDLNNVDKILSNLRVWLSATITYQETCLDGFENTTGDASEKVRKLLNTTMAMSSNGLAIVTEMSSIISAMEISSPQRRLMSVPDDLVIGHDVDDVLYDIEALMKWRRMLNNRKGRTLLGSVINDEDFHVLDKDGLPDWLDEPRRKLLHANHNHSKEVKPNVVVAKDGSGKYTTIAEALEEVPKGNNESFIIYVKEGVYAEYLQIKKSLTNVVLIGDGPNKTRITCNKNYIDGTPTFKTATLSVMADQFMAKDIGIENTAGPSKHQAVALRVQSDMSIFYNCHFDGYQDTLYTHTYRQYYRDCRVTGTIDFIFGDAAAFFQNCTFVVRKPLENQHCIVTAQGRKEKRQPTGIVIHNSTIVSDPEYFPVRFTNKAYLARPWKECSKTIFLESYFEDLIQPEGWLPWNGTFGLDTCYYGEYMNAGPGSNVTGRAKWRGVKTILPTRAVKFMPPILFGTDAWIRASGVPYTANLTTVPAKLADLSLVVDDEDLNAPSPSPTESYSENSSSSSSKSSEKEKPDHHGHEDSSSKKSSKDNDDHEDSSSKKSSQNDDDHEDSPSKKSSKDKDDHDDSSTKKSSHNDRGHEDSSSKNSTQDDSNHEDSSAKNSSQDDGDNEDLSAKVSSQGEDSQEESSSKTSSQNATTQEESSSKTSFQDATTQEESSSKTSSQDNDDNHEDSSSKNSSQGDGEDSTSEKSSHDESSSSEKSSSEGDESKSQVNPDQTIYLSPESSPSPTPGPIPSPSLHLTIKKQKTALKQRPVMKDFERVLMEDDDTAGDDDAAPAIIELQSPALSPSNGLGVAASGSSKPSNGRSLGPSTSASPAASRAQGNDKTDSLGPSTSPGPSTEPADDDVVPSPSEAIPADAVAPPKPTEKSGSTSNNEVQIILSGLAIWAALAM